MNVIISLILTTMVVLHPIDLYNFKSADSVQPWIIVNDGVMGGLSSSEITLTKNQTALFSGKVRTENNGGFASVRYRMEPMDASDYTSIILKVKGDGKRYQLRLKQAASNYYSYIQYFQTSGEWEEIIIELKDLYPSFRGYKMPQPNYSPSTIEELAFLISNKKAETFKIEIESISLN